MGLVLLDMTFRVERAFKIRLPKRWPQDLGLSWEQPTQDLALGEFHDYILRLCREQGVAVPDQSWAMLVRAVEDATGLKGSEITRDTRLIRDIGPTG